MYAHAEKFYYDLRVVYEIESRFRQLRGQPQTQEEETPKPAAPGAVPRTVRRPIRPWPPTNRGGRGCCQERTVSPSGWEPNRIHRGEKEPNPMKCANHPLNDASAYCGECGRALCNDCKRDVNGMVYCESCLAALPLAQSSSTLGGNRDRAQSRAWPWPWDSFPAWGPSTTAKSSRPSCRS